MSLDISKLQDVYILEYLKALDCPRSLTAYLLYAHNEHKQLSELEFIPEHYNSAFDACNSLSATKFLSKAKFLKTGNDLKEVALDGFRTAESVCEAANKRLASISGEKPVSSCIISIMQFKIANILRDFTPDELIDSCDWGPGSTTLLRRSQATKPEKFSVERKITAEAYDFVKPWFHLAYPHWDMLFEIDGSSKIVTVPKNAKTDRTIAIEPGINLWFQKGIGRLIRRRLRNNGIDLNSQVHNQEKARLGSKFNQLATVDFSMASDTISYELVKQVLPFNWFCLLDVFRSKFCRLDNEKILLRKFSSMGNGFTFELESLIFYALALATCEYLGIDSSDVSVFGDDVIIPSSAVDLFSEQSSYLGFKVNNSKSYSSGCFRESCGEYFWEGYRIKPFFLKEPFDGLHSVIKTANATRKHAAVQGFGLGCDSRFLAAWRLLVSYLGPKCPRVPIEAGDLGIIVNNDEAKDYRRPAKNGYEGFHVPVFAILAVNREIYSTGLYLFKLKSLGRSSDPDKIVRFDQDFEEPSCIGNNVPMPGKIRYTRKRILVPQWSDIGQWI